MTERENLAIATVLARNGERVALRQRVLDRFAIELPDRPRRASAGDVSLVGTGPGAWLAMTSVGAEGFATLLREAVAGLASVSDQSDGYAVVRIDGPKVREVLARHVFIDLHDRACRPGDAASTAFGQIPVILWRLDDGNDGSAAFEIALYRSFAASFWHALAP